MFSKSPLFGDFIRGFWLVLKGRKRSRSLWSGWWHRVITSLSPINEPFLSFNTNQKPRIKSPKSGDFENKNYIGCSPDPFSSRPNIKEEKVVWLRETNSHDVGIMVNIRGGAIMCTYICPHAPTKSYLHIQYNCWLKLWKQKFKVSVMKWSKITNIYHCSLYIHIMSKFDSEVYIHEWCTKLPLIIMQRYPLLNIHLIITKFIQLHPEDSLLVNIIHYEAIQFHAQSSWKQIIVHNLVVVVKHLLSSDTFNLVQCIHHQH